MNAFAIAKAVFPTKAHLLDRCAFRFGTNKGWIASAVAFTKGVTTRNQCHSFCVIHAHTRECFANINTRQYWIRVAVWPLWVHINQTHLHSGQWVFQITVTCIAFIVQPYIFNAPIDVFFWLPRISAAKAEAEGFETHGLHADVASQDKQVSPRNRIAVFLFQRPKQTTTFVEVAIVRPAVEGCETLLARACTATAIACAVCASRVP